LRPSDERIQYEKAQKELASGQYAFAVKLLEQLAARSPNDPKVCLALARAYIGVDQIDRAWAAISHAQQLGQGVIADPALTYQLANYYRQRSSYDRAAQLLRPLAAANMADARGQLSDLDAAWGDEQMNTNIEQAMHCWEEVQSLNTGSRLSEAPARLATIYQQYADKQIAGGDDKSALATLTKLNTIAQNPAYHEKTAQVYERMGLFDQACEQMRTAISLAGPQTQLNTELAEMLAKRGKQLLDSGDTQKGYDCLQQANDLDKTVGPPMSVLKNVSAEINPVNHYAQLFAEVTNIGQTPIAHVRVDAQLVLAANSKILWEGSQLAVGEYDPPLAPQSSRTIRFNAPVEVRSDGNTQFNIYINGKFYKNYLLGKKLENSSASTPLANPASNNQPSNNFQKTYRTSTPEDQTLNDLER
jgi:tetratricopeptide (TPR) repeat protein